jgi:hypothetical protein
MSDEKVWMEHPNLGPERKEEFSRKQASIWYRAGWRETDPPPPPVDPIASDRKAKAAEKRKTEADKKRKAAAAKQKAKAK